MKLHLREEHDVGPGLCKAHVCPADRLGSTAIELSNEKCALERGSVTV